MNTLNRMIEDKSRPAVTRARRLAYCTTLAIALVSAAAASDGAYAASVAKAPRHTYSAVAIGIGTLWSWLFGR